MIYHYIWTSTHPELRGILRQVNEDRSAAFYAVLKPLRNAVSNTLAAVSRFAENARRGARERAAMRELNALSDRTLKDIGVPRGEIRRIAHDLADGVTEPRVQVVAARARAKADALRTPFRPRILQGGRNGADDLRPEQPVHEVARKYAAGGG